MQNLRARTINLRYSVHTILYLKIQYEPWNKIWDWKIRTGWLELVVERSSPINVSSNKQIYMKERLQIYKSFHAAYKIETNRVSEE